MTRKFEGDINELKTLLQQSGIPGRWQDDSKGKHTFRNTDGGVINWWQNTGTLNFQGNAKAKAALEAVFDGTSLVQSPSVVTPGHKKAGGHKQIFIVHGHDTEARDQLELVLRRLGLEPFVLMNTSGSGKTIIEALEGQIGRNFTSDFGIVLMTPDDYGYAKEDGETKAEPRARQNVILEAGMLLSSLTRLRMMIIVKGHLEMPSDLQGVIYIGYNTHVKEIVPKLCQRLEEAGFDIDPSHIAAASQ